MVLPGDTYVFDPQISRKDALAYWFHPGNHAYVAERENTIVGTLPDAFQHAEFGFVDAYVMFRPLSPETIVRTAAASPGR